MKNNDAGAEPGAQLVLLEADHSGRDEMNLAGLPFALLQAATTNGQNVIRHQWERRLPGGKLVTASWQVAGDTVLGLPGPNEEAIYLVMLQLTREVADARADGQWPHKVFFSRADVLNRLGWANNTRSYNNLSDGLKRLQAVTIQADHCFYDARSGQPFASRNLGIISNTAIVAAGAGRKRAGQEKLSWFEWNSAFYESLCAGNVRNLALDFVLTLQYPTSRRLFRYLDMMRHAAKPPRRTFTIGAMKLRDKLGMKPYKYPSKVREKLDSAHGELLQNSYLAGVEWAQNKDGEWMVTYLFGLARIASGVDLPASMAFAGPPRGLQAPQIISGSDGFKIAPEAAHSVYVALPEAERLRLRDLARAEVESAFWDRIERPDSPMGLVLWELVAQEHDDAYRAALGE